MQTITPGETGQRDGGNAPASPFYIQLGTALRRTRDLKRMSLADVEQQSEGVLKSSAIASYERGNRRPPLEILVKIAAFYDTPVTQFLPAEEGSGLVAVDDVVAQIDALRDRLRSAGA